jgi:hypothetical protein
VISPDQDFLKLSASLLVTGSARLDTYRKGEESFDLQVSIHTVKHWLQILENLYIIFPVRPYHKNIARSILKESKYYLYDTGAVEGDLGAKMENTVACALLRELHLIEDTTGSRLALHFLRHKEKHEGDFLPVVDNRPLCMIDVKTSDDSFSPSLLRTLQECCPLTNS